MAKSKKDMLSGALSTPKKKMMPDVSKIEEITKRAYEPKKVSPAVTSSQNEERKRTTMLLPKSLHIKAKVHALENGLSLTDYFVSLLKKDLKKLGKL